MRIITLFFKLVMSDCEILSYFSRLLCDVSKTLALASGYSFDLSILLLCCKLFGFGSKLNCRNFSLLKFLSLILHLHFNSLVFDILVFTRMLITLFYSFSVSWGTLRYENMFSTVSIDTTPTLLLIDFRVLLLSCVY